jgi:nitroimidazol reductase NimA-like FMN-containing flavoprotein (pyridoxamine 5'-phosphate oxidase superfamily)
MTTREMRGIDALSRTECLDLLARSHLGRLAFIDRVGVFPIIVPVNYLVHDGSVVFRTGPGAKLAAAVRGADVAFEVDEADDVERTGWSVLVRGTAEEILDPDELAELEHHHLQPQAPGDKRHYVGVDIDLVTGRRIDLDTAAGAWWDPTP